MKRSSGTSLTPSRKTFLRAAVSCFRGRVNEQSLSERATSTGAPPFVAFADKAAAIGQRFDEGDDEKIIDTSPTSPKSTTHSYFALPFL